VGLLSRSEVETGIPVCDALKRPARPVWLVHGGDHFTVLFRPWWGGGAAADARAAVAAADADADAGGASATAAAGAGAAGDVKAAFARIFAELVKQGVAPNAAAAQALQQAAAEAAKPAAKSAKAAPAGGAQLPALPFLHWNGLPPGGPRMAAVAVAPRAGPGRGPDGAVGPAPAAHTPGYVKPVPGEIDSVVQSRKEDKAARPDAYRTWRYEVVLAVDDPTVADSGAKRADVATFAQGDAAPGEPWRCAACYAQRFKTMCFGLNDPLPPAQLAAAGDDVQGALRAQPCRHCAKPRGEGGWSLWMPFERLPPPQQRQMARRHAAKVEVVLWTKWPEAAVHYGGDNSKPPSV